jgi:hypothetical protein
MGLFKSLRKTALRDRFADSVEALIAHHPAPVPGNFSRR